jgi:hypothetical protein
MATESGKNKYNKYGQPSLDFVFSGTKKSLKDRSGNTQVEFTRDTIGTYVDENGIIKTAVADEARFEEEGLLVEESRTNSLTYSVDFSQQFNAVRCSITANSTVAPDGTSTATTLIEKLSGNTHQLSGFSYTGGVPQNGDGTHTFSVFAKAKERSVIAIATNRSGAGQHAVATFDLSAGVVSQYGGTNDGTVDYVGSSIISVGNGWYRCTLTYSSVGDVWPTIGIINTPTYTYENFGRYSYQGDGTSGVYIWGVQMEQNSAFPTSYIPTSGSTVTRSPDIAQVTNSSIYDVNKFTILNEPFGASSGAESLSFIGPNVKRTTVYSSNLSQTNINVFVDKTDEFWQWRILGSSFALPTFTTDGQVTVDWGDGTVETLTTSEHTFTNGGGYHDVGFRLDSGTNFYPTLNNNATHKDKVIAVGPGPESMKVDLANMLQGASNLVSIDSTISLMSASNRKLRQSICLDCTSLKSFPYIDFSGASLSSIRFAWKNCTSMESFPLLDLSQANNLGDAGGRGTWTNCSSLKSFPAIHFPNVTIAVTAWQNCSSMTEFNATGFGLCYAFNSAWNSCSSLTSFPEIDTSSGTNFSNTWANCSSLTSFPLIDTSSGTNFPSAWQNCASLTSFPLIDISSAASISHAWYGCNSLTSFPLIDTSSATEFREAWRVCSSLTSFPVIDVSSGTSFYMTWRQCGFASFPALNFTLGQTFYYCWANNGNLVNFPAGCWDNWNPASVSNYVFDNAFDGCSSLSATSVENILNSINVSAASTTPPATGVNIGIDYATSTGTPDIAVSAIDLTAKGWTPTLNNVAQTNQYSFASLDLDFATNLTLNDNISNSNLITFSRSTTATYVDSSGVIQTAAVDTPRFDHDPVTNESLGLLIEESRTNQWAFSNDFSQSKYNHTGVNVNQNVLAPDGTNTAWSIADTAVQSRHNLDALGVSSFQSGVGDLTTSVYVKPISGTKIITIYTKGSGNQGRGQMKFNPVTKVVTLQNGTSVGDAIDVGNGWYRIWFTYNYSTNEGGINVRISFNEYSSYTGGNDEFYIWGLVQENGGTFPTSYIPTAGSTVTRSADTCSIEGTNFTDFYNQSGGTWFGEVKKAYPTTQRLLEVGVSSNYGYSVSIRPGATSTNFARLASGASSVNHTYPAKFACADSVTDIRGCVNGTLATLITTGSSPTDDKLVIGGVMSATASTNAIARIAYWPKRLTDTSLQYLTQ